MNNVNSSSYLSVFQIFASAEIRNFVFSLNSQIFFFTVWSDFSGVWAKCDKKAELTITAPKKMVAISGSCLQIPCSFNISKTHMFDGSRSTFGVWIKNDSRFAENLNNVIFNSSITGNGYPMVFTGNLSERNCTTLFSSLLPTYTNRYFFRVENRQYRATASCNPINITVQGKTSVSFYNIVAALALSAFVWHYCILSLFLVIPINMHRCLCVRASMLKKSAWMNQNTWALMTLDKAVYMQLLIMVECKLIMVGGKVTNLCIANLGFSWLGY